MQFRCTVKGEQYLVQADLVGGYTHVIFRASDGPDGETVAYQLFPTEINSTDIPSSPIFLERAARIALGHFHTAEKPFPLVTMIGYKLDYATYTGELLVV